MNKLSLNKNGFSGKEILSRKQLRKITGGDFGTSYCFTLCYLEEGSGGNEIQCNGTMSECALEICSLAPTEGCYCESHGPDPWCYL